MRNLQNLKVFGSTLTFRASKQPNLRDIHEPFSMVSVFMSEYNWKYS